jgi:DNA-binding CsgD family transcriptional regulator
VPERLVQPSAEIVGREAELAALYEFVDSDRFPRALVLWGGPGIGKTTLWEAGVEAARARGVQVLTRRASEAEAQLSFAALIDLLDGVDVGALPDVPPPQRSALEVALLRAEPAGVAPEPRTIAFGFLNALRALAARAPLLVAIDDVQWLDGPSMDALAFTARRLDHDPVPFLLAKRASRVSPLERAIGPRLQRFEVPSLSLGAIRRLLAERLGLSPSRQLLRRIVDTTLGNPLFALELGRSLAGQGAADVGDELPVPDAVEDLLGTRVARLPASVRRLLLAVALDGDLSPAQLSALADIDALDDAVHAGVLVVDGDRVRAAHPLLAAAASSRARAGEHRELHLALAGVVCDDELRARHLAAAATGPDETLAALVATAAGGAAARGAAREAVILGEHALRLTPPDSPERPERVVAVAGYLSVAGEKQRVTSLLSRELDSLPPGSPRVRACLLLPGGVVRTNDELRGFLERALAESGNDRGARAAVLANIATNDAVIRVERIRQAEAWAREALPASRTGGPELERIVLYALAWVRSLRGLPIDDLRDRFGAASDATAHLVGSPERVAGQQLVWRGRLDEARDRLTRLLSLADERGEQVAYGLARLHVCELSLRAGEWDAAARLLDEWAEPSERALLEWPMYERCRALLAAGRGLPDEAERWAAEAIARAEDTGVGWDRLEALRARGQAALLERDPERAEESLRLVWEHTEREGVEEPGVFPVAPELVEALVEKGEVEDARVVAARLRELAGQDHPWGLATAKRCDGAIGLADSGESAADLLGEAAEEYESLGLRFDHARALLVLGRGERRRKRWAASRAALEGSAAAFDAQGSPGWAEYARAELERVGGRQPRSTGDLTPTERRVAELAVEGLANKEIAAALFVAVHTVEVHLSHVYAKLGVRSRAQLGRRLARA